ncbi:glycosyltransferase family 39 protein [Candidatus Pelagibacter communis]|uniref:glycosyltransferase family 39 protein n=1 Tax=Pelagibacter ubique TaxID=198252 RepID=UPI00094CDC50|nr:glycosyltransferase family 39 protein [Candidatus Pelagibacter ubique]
MFKKSNISNLFYFFLVAHLLIWTLIPYITNNNLPLDTIEALAWGSNLDWGYNKHPPVSAFFVEFFYFFFGSNDIAYYFLSQIFVISAFYIVWIFSNEFFQNKTLSFFSVLILEGIYFYNFTTPEFNVNVCQLPFWAFTVYLTWKLYMKKDTNTVILILLGVTAAIGFLTKYLFAYLLLSIVMIFAYEFFITKTRKIDFKHYLPIEIFFVLLVPHLIWLFQNDFVTIKYAFNRAGLVDYSFLNHFKFPIIFLVKQIGILIPFFVLCYFVIKKIKVRFDIKDKKKFFILLINFLPIILMLITSVVTGSKIRTMWMTPFYLFFGIFILSIFDIKDDEKTFKEFFKPFLILFLLSPITYGLVSLISENKRTDYQGKIEVDKVLQIWQKDFTKPINVVLGDEWHAGNISYHMKGRPVWLGEINQENVDLLNAYICTKKVCVGYR